jgi:hypothetical protein
MRSPPKQIQLLLPVWGDLHTRIFLELGLPSFLAPRNIPALGQLCGCTFVLLAPREDAEKVQQHPLWVQLQRHCAVSVTHIDDLISQSSSTVLTLAYALAIRASGPLAPDTCFVPLVADYVMSDGSLSSAVKRVFDGASAVLAGNFQIALEAALPALSAARSADGILAIGARDIVALSLTTLHSATRDLIITTDEFPAGANRLFWRVDDHRMIGRFYLMHMIVVRPETLDFVIAAPSDYSLVIELCPSGNIAYLTNSDEYFVVECLPDTAAQDRVESISLESFGDSLATWATRMHYDNARHPLHFRSNGPPSAGAEQIASSEFVVMEIEARRKAPLPHRGHPIWARLLDHHLTTAQMEQDLERLSWITGDASLRERVMNGSRLRSLLLGRAPHFRLWHPSWRDALLLKRAIVEAEGKVAIVSDLPARGRTWLDQVAKLGRAHSVEHLRVSGVWAARRDESRIGQFDTIVCYLDRAPESLDELLACFCELSKDDGKINLIFGRLFDESEFQSSMPLVRGLQPVGTGLERESSVAVVRSQACEAAQNAMMHSARKSVYSRGFAAVQLLLEAASLAVVSSFFNVFWVRTRSPASAETCCSSLLVKYRKASTGQRTEPISDAGPCKLRPSEIAG